MDVVDLGGLGLVPGLLPGATSTIRPASRDESPLTVARWWCPGPQGWRRLWESGDLERRGHAAKGEPPSARFPDFWFR